MHKLLVLCDIDGTLADVSPLARLAGPEPSRDNRIVYRRWADVMTSRLLSAPPNEPVLELVRTLYAGGAHVVYVTSREESHRDVTQEWLKRVHAPHGHLLMRGFEDWRSTAEVKQGIILGLLERHKGPAIAIDDDAPLETSPVYKQLGISHLRVMDFLGAWEQDDSKAGEG